MKTSNATRAWLSTGALALALAAGACAVQLKSSVHAAGGGWETNGIMANTLDGGDSDRVVLIDTNKKNMAVYKCLGSGQFRLMSARDYRYDLLLEDTSKIPQIEQAHGITAVQASELWQKHLNANTAASNQKP